MNHLKEQKDETLVDLTLLGNDAAYEELVIRYGKLVNSVAYRITGNKYSAEDAAQDAFVSAWMKLDTLNEREKFSSWVCRIAVSYTHLRAHETPAHHVCRHLH